MSSLIRKLIAVLLTLVLIGAVLPIAGAADTCIITDKSISLKFVYKNGEQIIPGASFALYKVADTDEYAHMTLTPEFTSYLGSVSGLASINDMTQEQWLALASTLDGYVRSDGLTPAAQGITDGDGVLELPDLPAGLYLLLGSRVTIDDNMYSAVPFMIFLPGKNAENGDWEYDVTVTPKNTKSAVPPVHEVVTRKALKIWDDAGYESLRPSEVTVQLLKDGAVFDTQKLNMDNNWSYTWDELEAEYEWDVIEKGIEGYAVSVTQNGITFTVTNRYVVPASGTDIPIGNRIIGDKPDKDSEFKFILTPEDSGNPMPDGSNGTTDEVSIIGAGSTVIGGITFTEPGTYVYTVREENGGVEGYTYDDTVYTVIYEVTEKNGELIVTCTIIDSDGNTYSEIEFVNKYKTPGGKLPQTGALWWPVPILLTAGVLLVLIGIFSRRRYS